MSILLRLATLAMLIVFLSWAGFQYNDPDPVLWMTVYGLAAVGCLLFLLHRFPRKSALVYVALCLCGAALLWIRVVADGKFFFDEQGREAIGLMIVATWTFVLYRRSTTKTRQLSAAQ